MKNIICYSYSENYGEKRTVRKTLKDLVRYIVGQGLRPLEFLKFTNITCYYDDNSEEDVSLADYIEEVVILEEKRKEIESLIDGEIKKNEAFIEKTLSETKGPITGWFGITSRNREWAIENELNAAKYRWKTELL